MLKTRVIPCLTIKDLRLVKSVQFANHRNIGSYIAAVRVFNARDVDEMVVLDLDGRLNGIKSWLLEEITKECFMPLTVGGGIKTVEDIRLLFKIGADKVVLNTTALKDPSFVQAAAKIFGSQSIVVSIDARRRGSDYEVFSHGGHVATGLHLIEWAQEVESRGAGEIFLTSIDHDGMMDCYDVELIKKVSEAVRIPVIASGGAGNLDHFIYAIKEGGASAVAAASIFQYTQVTPMNVKQYLVRNGIQARV